MPLSRDEYMDEVAAHAKEEGKWWQEQHHPKIRWIGIRHWGDMGPLTMYRSQRNLSVIYAKAPPKVVASLAQKQQRLLFQCTAMAWSRLPQNDKDDWEKASKGASLGITGYNLFVYSIAKHDVLIAAAVSRMSGVPLVLPQVD